MKTAVVVFAVCMTFYGGFLWWRLSGGEVSTGEQSVAESGGHALLSASVARERPEESETKSAKINSATPENDESLSTVNKSPTIAPTAPTSNTSASIAIGAYIGWQPEAVSAFEAQTNTLLSLAAVSVHWGNENQFPTGFKRVLAENGKTLVIFWNPMDYNRDIDDQDEFSYEHILTGEFDEYIEQFASDAREYGGPVILIPFEEMNGQWAPWSGVHFENGAELHKEAYRYIARQFINVPNVQMGWTVNSVSVPNTGENAISAYYPGGAYVDFVGVNGFDWGGRNGESFDELFARPIATLATYQKPMYIFSMATAEGEHKAEWITSMFESEVWDNRLVRGFIWFDEDKERDWRVASSEESLDAFRKGSGQ